jgi:hypothetical protein
VEKAYDFAQKNPALIPPYLDMGAFGADFADAHGLWTLLNSVQQLEEGIDDTEMTAGSEAYQAALVFYHSVKLAASIEPKVRGHPRRQGGPRRTPHPLSPGRQAPRRFAPGRFRFEVAEFASEPR